MRFQFALDLVEKRSLARSTRRDVVNFHAIDACCALVGFHALPGCFQHHATLRWRVAPKDAVIQRIEPELRLRLRLVAQLLSQLRNFLRQPGFHPPHRFLRSGIKIQAGFPLLTASNVSSQAPLLHDHYSLPGYYGPVRFPSIAARAVIDSRPRLVTPFQGAENSISPPRRWVSQVPRLIFAHALSHSTPESSTVAPACCFTADAGLQHIRQIGRLHWRNEASVDSLALRLARSPCEASRVPLLDTHARLATCQTSNYRVGTFHPTRSARLILAHRMTRIWRIKADYSFVLSAPIRRLRLIRGLSLRFQILRGPIFRIPAARVCRHTSSVLQPSPSSIPSAWRPVQAGPRGCSSPTDLWRGRRAETG